MSRPPEVDGFHFEAQLLVVAFERVRAVLEMLPRRRFVGTSPVAAPVGWDAGKPWRLLGRDWWRRRALLRFFWSADRAASSSSIITSQPT